MIMHLATLTGCRYDLMIIQKGLTFHLAILYNAQQCYLAAAIDDKVTVSNSRHWNWHKHTENN